MYVRKTHSINLANTSALIKRLVDYRSIVTLNNIKIA